LPLVESRRAAGPPKGHHDRRAVGPRCVFIKWRLSQNVVRGSTGGGVGGVMVVVVGDWGSTASCFWAGRRGTGRLAEPALRFDQHLMKTQRGFACATVVMASFGGPAARREQAERQSMRAGRRERTPGETRRAKSSDKEAAAQRLATASMLIKTQHALPSFPPPRPGPAQSHAQNVSRTASPIGYSPRRPPRTAYRRRSGSIEPILGDTDTTADYAARAAAGRRSGPSPTFAPKHLQSANPPNGEPRTDLEA
jgi:hypothetical protein